MTRHYNEPHALGFSKDHEQYFRKVHDEISFLSNEIPSLFSGLNQTDLFLFAYALGRYYHQSTLFDGKIKNISVSAMSEHQKWSVLSGGIVDNGDLNCLKDEKIIYGNAENCAYSGMNILLEELNKYGPDEFPEKLTEQLRDILREQ